MIALFGGTFDPVHLGHLNMAEQCVAELGLSELRFLPCAMPVHKAQPKITDTHRLNQPVPTHPHLVLQCLIGLHQHDAFL